MESQAKASDIQSRFDIWKMNLMKMLKVVGIYIYTKLITTLTIDIHIMSARL